MPSKTLILSGQSIQNISRSISMEKQKDGKPPKKPIGRPPKKLSVTSPKTPSMKNIAATFSSPPQNKDINTVKTASPIRCYKCREVCLDKESFTDEDLRPMEVT